MKVKKVILGVVMGAMMVAGVMVRVEPVAAADYCEKVTVKSSSSSETIEICAKEKSSNQTVEITNRPSINKKIDGVWFDIYMSDSDTLVYGVKKGDTMSMGELQVVEGKNFRESKKLVQRVTNYLKEKAESESGGSLKVEITNNESSSGDPGNSADNPGGNNSGDNPSGDPSASDPSNPGGNSGNNGSSATPLPVRSSIEQDPCVETLFFGKYCDEEGKGEGVFKILGIVLDVLTYGVGVLAVVGFVMVGIQYTTARDNEGQVAKAKERLMQIVIGLAIYMLLYILLQFFIPGGVF